MNQNGNDVVLFCVIRNDLQRLKQFLPYYRNLGIQSFVFTDNGSTDGTYEYLSEQEDVILYSMPDKYSCMNRIKWIQSMLHQHGKHKWCVVVDSDEFISYVGCETHNLVDLINFTEFKGYVGIAGFLLDMYSDSKMFVGNTFDMDAQRYFDYAKYQVNNRSFGVLIYGGPRSRLFGIRNGISKYPIFYYCDGVSYTNAHYLHIHSNRDYKLSPIWLAIRHYKFQTQSDFTKMKEAIANRTYYNGSMDYVPIYDYIQDKCIPTMYNCDVSRYYATSDSLRCIDILQEPFLESEDDIDGKTG